jgi:hypothetical protein
MLASTVTPPPLAVAMAYFSIMPCGCLYGLTDAGPCWIVSMVMLKTEWDRELSWFIRVAPTERFFLPTCTRHPIQCSTEAITEQALGGLLGSAQASAVPLHCTSLIHDNRHDTSTASTNKEQEQADHPSLHPGNGKISARQ